jgi:hypothetical protein
MVRNGFATDAEAHRALVRPLGLDRGRRLPPLRGVSIIPGPPFQWGELGLGCAALALGAGALIALQRRRARLPRLAAIGSRAAGAFAIAAGLLLVLGSFRGA